MSDVLMLEHQATLLSAQRMGDNDFQTFLTDFRD